MISSSLFPCSSDSDSFRPKWGDCVLMVEPYPPSKIRQLCSKPKPKTRLTAAISSLRQSKQKVKLPIYSSPQEKKRVWWADNSLLTAVESIQTPLRPSTVPVPEETQNTRVGVIGVARAENLHFMPVRGAHVDLMNGTFHFDSNTQLFASTASMLSAAETLPEESELFVRTPQPIKRLTFQESENAKRQKNQSEVFQEPIDLFQLYSPLPESDFFSSLVYSTFTKDSVEHLASPIETTISEEDRVSPLETDSSVSSTVEDLLYEPDEIFYFHSAIHSHQRKCYARENRFLIPNPIIILQKDHQVYDEHCPHNPNSIDGGSVKFSLIRRDIKVDVDHTIYSNIKPKKKATETLIDCSAFLSQPKTIKINNGVISTRLKVTTHSQDSKFFLRVLISYKHPRTGQPKTQVLESQDFSIRSNSKSQYKFQ